MKITGVLLVKRFPLLCILILLSTFANAQVTGPNCPTRVSTAPSPGGTVAWADVQLALCDDNSARAYTEALHDGQHSQYLFFTGFGLDVPADAIIQGIEVVLIRKADRSKSVTDHTVRLIQGGKLVGTNLASPEAWDTEWTGAFYGSKDSRWGLDMIGYDISSKDFGVAIDVKGNSYSRAEIDEVRVTVHYKEQSPTANTKTKRSCQALPAALGI